MKFEKIESWDELLKEYFLSKILKPFTEKSYAGAVRYLSDFLGPDVKPNDVTRKHILLWRREMISRGIKPVSWNSRVAHVAAVFSHGIDLKWLTHNQSPFYKTKLSVGIKEKKTLSQAQLDVIDKTMDRFQKEEDEGNADYRGCALYPVWYWRTVLALFRTTGLRRNQILHIRLCDIDFINKTIHFSQYGSKTDREWKIPILDFMAQQLKILYLKSVELKAKPNDLLFDVHRYRGSAKTASKPLSGLTLCHFFIRLTRECGFKVSSHRFRHTLATNLMKTPNRNILLVQGLLGHSSIKTTREYVTLDVNALRKNLEEELSTDIFVRDSISKVTRHS
ncbi:site-specific integrase [Rouxiella badensis]|uniref:tyrosine-type recombinase/integrase n=1 Tax=Rouxiella badensis TaxID=1646377 RepID=UPI001D13D0C7|nr:site-specific integrase [Rouxiella badensis]MCC3701647.1 site-specific integrase [Rouxiella badensis]